MILGIFEDDHNSLETPVPIPNTEAKPARPMVVLWARVGSSLIVAVIPGAVFEKRRFFGRIER